MITAIEPKLEESGRYSQNQTCEALGICRRTLREHTNQGLIKCGFRKANMRKFYTGFEIRRYWRAQY